MLRLCLGGLEGRLAKIATMGRAHGIVVGPHRFRVSDTSCP